MSINHAALLVACPQCDKETAWRAENPWRPFCSERCKLIDLGKWADGSYCLPIENSDSVPDVGEAP